MVHKSLDNLRLDRRLENRRAWLSPQERERELAALPDVADKVAPPEEEAASEGGTADAAPSETRAP